MTRSLLVGSAPRHVIRPGSYVMDQMHDGSGQQHQHINGGVPIVSSPNGIATSPPCNAGHQLGQSVPACPVMSFTP